MTIKKIHNFSEAAIQSAKFYCFGEKTHLSEVINSAIIIEKPIKVIINKKKQLTIFATPTNVTALIIGLLYSLKLIEHITDITSFEIKTTDILQVTVELANKNLDIDLEHIIINSSQGTSNIMYGKDWRRNNLSVYFNTKIQANILIQLIAKLEKKQKIYTATHGAHGASIFNHLGKLIAFAEDIGRHNALDKVIGKCLLKNNKIMGCGIILTSRVSFEMVAKAARAGLEFIIAISVPTTLAIATANEWNITLCRLAKQKLNIYTHPLRILA